MFVRFLEGRRKGEIAEMKFADAKVLFESGRAEQLIYDDRPTNDVTQNVADPLYPAVPKTSEPPRAAKKAKKEKRK